MALANFMLALLPPWGGLFTGRHISKMPASCHSMDGFPGRTAKTELAGANN